MVRIRDRQGGRAFAYGLRCSLIVGSSSPSMNVTGNAPLVVGGLAAPRRSGFVVGGTDGSAVVTAVRIVSGGGGGLAVSAVEEFLLSSGMIPNERASRASNKCEIASSRFAWVIRWPSGGVGANVRSGAQARGRRLLRNVSQGSAMLRRTASIAFPGK